MYKWPLAKNNFTWLDRLKICKFFLTKPNRWTQGKYVKEYEEKLKDYTGARYAVYVSSGSAANQLIAQFTKDKLIKENQWPARNHVVVNSVTWQSNVSVWVREGFKPIFIDVNLNDFCLDYDKLSEYLIVNHDKVACVFPTSVLGFVPEINRLEKLCKHFQVPLKFDNCENVMSSYGSYFNRGNQIGGFVINICREFTCSTSCFLAHQISNGTEGGFIFTNSKEEYEYYLMARAHGLIRNLQPYSENFVASGWEHTYDYELLYNPLVDYQFDFHILSSNYRSSDIAAFCGLLDFKRIHKNKSHRIKIYNTFRDNLNHLRYYLPKDRDGYEDVPFCIPIIVSGCDKEYRLNKIKEYLDEQKIERRSFISGNMLRQNNYQQYGNYKDYENAEYLNNYAIYIGLDINTTEKQVLKLVEFLNKI